MMKELEERILKDGIVIGPDILKVDSFLNQQIDSKLIHKMGIEFANYFRDKKIDKVLTVESSGIAPALATALELEVNCVFARKNNHLPQVITSIIQAYIHLPSKLQMNLLCQKTS